MFSSPALAQTAGAAPSAGPNAMLLNLPFILALFAIRYFFMIRPQQVRAKQHKAMLEALKKGDVAVTGGGLIGRVTKVDGDEVEIELAPGMKVRAVKATLSEVRGTSKPAND
jgi:preprotein translocase subunit YajC